MNMLMGGKGSGGHGSSGGSGGGNPLGGLAAQFLGGGSHGSSGGGSGGGKDSIAGKLVGQLASNLFSPSSGGKPSQSQNYHGGSSGSGQHQQGGHQQGGLAGVVGGGLASIFGGEKPGHGVSNHRSSFSTSWRLYNCEG
jgi:hypothetical protein